jgi:predicted secreted acid phosphatase
MSAHNTLHALLFQATSAEYVALCLQAYQLARHALRDRLSLGTFRNPAVIFDLDETVLDNHAYAAWQIKNGELSR